MADVLVGFMANFIQWELQPIFKQPSKTWWVINLLFLCTLYYSTLFAVMFFVATLKGTEK